MGFHPPAAGGSLWAAGKGFRNSFGARHLLLRSGTAVGDSRGGVPCAPLLPLAAVSLRGLLSWSPSAPSGRGCSRCGWGWSSAELPSPARMALSHRGGEMETAAEGQGSSAARWVLPNSPRPRGVGVRSSKEQRWGTNPQGAAKCFHRPARGQSGRARLCPSCRLVGADGRTDGRGSPPRALLLLHCLHGTEPGVVKSNEVMSKKTFQESLWAVFSPCCAAKGRLGTSPSSAGSSPLCPCLPEVCPGATRQCRTGGAGAAPGEMRGCGTAR